MVMQFVLLLLQPVLLVPKYQLVILLSSSSHSLHFIICDLQVLLNIRLTLNTSPAHVDRSENGEMCRLGYTYD